MNLTFVENTFQVSKKKGKYKGKSRSTRKKHQNFLTGSDYVFCRLNPKRPPNFLRQGGGAKKKSIRPAWTDSTAGGILTNTLYRRDVEKKRKG